MTDNTTYRTCPLCEATCGLELTVRDGAVTRIRGDRNDVFSRGFICPKGSTLRQLHDDPDRLRRPLIRRDDVWTSGSWEEAFELVEARLLPIVEQHGPNAVAAYLGNPNVHTMAGPLYNRPLLKALGTRNIFSASTVDQMPKHVSAGLMFGHADSIPVPDIDRTDYLLMLGADPFVSNGSLATAPDWPGRIAALQHRGGSLVVVDPRRSRTAQEADEHLSIRPGTDALLLFSIVAVLFEEDLAVPGRLAGMINGLSEVAELSNRFPPEKVENHCGIRAAAIRRIARELAAAPTAVVYGRVGTHTVEFGSVAAWLVDVINVLIGALDQPGGAMFPLAAHARPPRKGRPFRTGRWASRVRGLPEVRGELPVATLADEIDTPGPGQVRALVTVAGNPVLSTPDGNRLDRALASLEFMVSVDPYLNETTRHADVILPPPSPLSRGHYDFAFYQLSVRNIANYSPPTLGLDGGMPEWEILTRLTLIASGQGASGDPALADGFGIATTVNRAISDPASPVAGRDPAELLQQLNRFVGPERILDFLLRTGPYGDRFGENPEGLTLDKLMEHPHGIDLGPLEPRLPGLLTTESGRIELAPVELIADATRLAATLEEPPSQDLLLVGRRHLRSNNSWMHNLEILMKGKERCTLLMHPHDAGERGFVDGDRVAVRNENGSVTAPIEITADIRAGVVSLPHGWGHDLPGVRLAVASQRPGVNSNVLAGRETIDAPSGNAVLNAIPVTVEKAEHTTG
jgi:anaerobic selenocysteine-containing dehydrogenase